MSVADPNIVIPPPAAPWHAGLDADFVGALTNRGLVGKTPVEAALEFHKAHREAEKFIGQPADQLLRLPKDPADTEGWKAVHTRLGVPTDAKGYDLSAIKDAKGQPLDTNFVEWFQNTAAENHLPAPAAQALAGKLVEFQSRATAAQDAERAVALATEKSTLATNWGGNAAANMLAARAAAAALGVPPEAVSALENVVGYAKVMEMFRTISTKIGEDKFVSSGSALAPGTMSRDQATSEKRTLMADNAWVVKYLKGDAAAGKQMRALEQIIAGITIPA